MVYKWYKISDKDHFWETAKLWHWNVWEVLSIVLSVSLHIRERSWDDWFFTHNLNLQRNSFWCNSIHYLIAKFYTCHNSTETKMSSLWRNFHHWLHWKLSFWQLPVQPVMNISSKWRLFCFSEQSFISRHSFDENMKYYKSQKTLLIIQEPYCNI